MWHLPDSDWTHPKSTRSAGSLVNGTSAKLPNSDGTHVQRSRSAGCLVMSHLPNYDWNIRRSTLKQSQLHVLCLDLWQWDFLGSEYWCHSRRSSQSHTYCTCCNSPMEGSSIVQPEVSNKFLQFSQVYTSSTVVASSNWSKPWAGARASRQSWGGNGWEETIITTTINGCQRNASIYDKYPKWYQDNK